jgi:putative MATE family efflux protein
MNKLKETFKSLIYPEKNFYRTVFSLAIPIMLQNLITIGINITDTLMLGRLGELQLSASALATQFVNIFQTLIMGVSMGASVMISRYWGMREMTPLKKTISIMFRLILCISAIFMLVTAFFPQSIMRMYSSETDVIAEGVQYLKFAVLAYLLHGLSLGSTNVLRSVQKVRLPMCVSLVSFVLNIFGNYVLIFGKFGLPRMGIAGASLSTLIVRIVECLFNFGYLVVLEKNIGYRLKDLFMRTGDLVSEYIRIGFPVLISDGLAAISNNFVMMIVGRMGSSFVSANAVAAVVERLCSTSIHGVGNASSLLTGKALGEGRIEEVKRMGSAFVGLGLLLGAIGSVIILVIIQPVIGIYGLTGQTAENAGQILTASAILVLFQSGNGILTKGMLRGGGDTRMLMVADSVFQWCVSIPLGYLAGLVLGLPAFWVYLCLKIDNICKMFWGVWRMKSGKWIKKIRT